MIAVVNCLHCNRISSVGRSRKCKHCGRSLTPSIRAAIREDIRQFDAQARMYERFAANARKQLAALKGKR